MLTTVVASAESIVSELYTMSTHYHEHIVQMHPVADPWAIVQSLDGRNVFGWDARNGVLTP